MMLLFKLCSGLAVFTASVQLISIFLNSATPVCCLQHFQGALLLCTLNVLPLKYIRMQTSVILGEVQQVLEKETGLFCEC